MTKPKSMPRRHSMKRYGYILMPTVLVAAAWIALVPSITGAQTLSGMAGAQVPRENAVNIDWAYNWGIEPNHDVTKANFDFVPMIWSASTNGNGLQNQIDRVLNLETNYGIDVDYVLGFNEPELPTQANMSVQTALSTWDTMTNAFEGTDLKMVSPAVSGNGGLQNWLYPFMDEVENRNADADQDNDLQVDAIAYHFYTVAYNPQTEANKLLAHIDEIWNKYQLPIWLTEFAGTSFSLNNPVHSIEERTAFNEAFLEILIPEFEARPYLERYAWWQFGALGQPYSKLSNVSNGVYTPTDIGKVYSGTSWNSGEIHDLASGESRDSDVHYFYGGTLTNTGPAITTALRAIDVIEDASTIGGSSDWGQDGDEEAFVRIRTGASLEKTGSNTIHFSGTSVTNDGILLVNGGTLAVRRITITNRGELRAQAGIFSLEGGSELGSSGTAFVEAGGTISFGIATDTAGARISQPLALDGGTILANPIISGSHIISGTSTLSSTTTFSGEGNLFVTAPILASTGGGSGGIIKEGAGELLLNRPNTFTGDTVINDGKLRLGFSSSIDDSPAIKVGPHGTLDVMLKFSGFNLTGQTLELEGQVDGSIIATDGSVVEVLSSDALFNGGLTLVDSTVTPGMDEALTMRVSGDYLQDSDSTLWIDLLDTSTHDLVDVVGLASLAGTLEVVELAGLDPEFGDSFTILSADGGITGMFDNLALPSLASGKTFKVNYQPNDVVLTVVGSPADFDADGDVDDADLTIWQAAYDFDAQGDANGDGLTNGADLLVWQNEFTGALNLVAPASVPEPSTLSIVFITLLGTTCGRATHARRHSHSPKH